MNIIFNLGIVYFPSQSQYEDQQIPNTVVVLNVSSTSHIQHCTINNHFFKVTIQPFTNKADLDLISSDLDLIYGDLDLVRPDLGV